MEKIRVLLVEDMPEQLDSWSQALQSMNKDWQIFPASTPEQSQKIMEKQLKIGEPIDVVLTDLWLHKRDLGIKGGEMVLINALKLDPTVMVILYSADIEELDRYQTFEKGAYEVINTMIFKDKVFNELSTKANSAFRQRKRNREVERLSRYFDPKVCEKIRDNPEVLELKERNTTICFWDIRGFTNMCNVLRSETKLIEEFLKEYFDMGAKTIFEHSGILDKFIGDGIMAVFGIFEENEDYGANLAVNTALVLRNRFIELREKFYKDCAYHTTIEFGVGLGCGIHTGKALVGVVGTESRDQFTALGDMVNIAARIESKARGKKSENSPILISQTTYARVQADFNISKLNSVEVKGQEGNPIVVYEVLHKK